MAEAATDALGSETKRNVLIPVDDSEGSEKALQWAVDNLYSPGTEFHLFHVVPIPRPQVVGALGGISGVDDFIVADPDPAEDKKHIEDAQRFTYARFGFKLEKANIPYQVEIVHFDTDNDSIGQVVCKRAEAINASAVVMAKHNKGSVKEFFLGSCSKYCVFHSTHPVVIIHA